MKKWASTTGWNQDKRLSVLIPSGKVPAYLNDSLLAIWKERSDLQKLYPEVAKGNLTSMKKWASTTGWNQDKRLAVLIPSGKVPAYLQKPFPVSDTILTTIWKERSDLQKLYPEAAKGNLTGMKKWASTTGWNQDKRLAALIPPSKVPVYLNDSLLAIWKERSDLQKLYPEVAKGNLTSMKKWASTTGWNLYVLLAALIPSGKIPKYLDDSLSSIWKERSDLQKLYPEVAKGNLTSMKKWASTTGWNQDKRLAVLIPSGKVPAYLQKPFPVSDTILTTIWKERSDLQKLYPEVAKGNLTSMKKWASTTGWNQDKRLSVLI